MRTTFAYRKFICESCRRVFSRVIEIAPNTTLSMACECGNQALQEEVRDSLNHNIFRPFWSDTLQMRIKDREDLKKLRQYAKDHGLVNVGHENMKPDRAAIRHNYEHD